MKKMAIISLGLGVYLTCLGQAGWSVINKSDTDVRIYTPAGTTPERYVSAGSTEDGWDILPHEVIGVLACWAYQKGNQTGDQGTCISQTIPGAIGYTEESGSITITGTCSRYYVNGVQQCRNMPILQSDIPPALIKKKKSK